MRAIYQQEVVGRRELREEKFVRQTGTKMHFLLQNHCAKESFDTVHLFLLFSSQTKENTYHFSHHSHSTKYFLQKQCVYLHIPQVNRSVKLIYFLLLFLLKCYRENLGIININSKQLQMIKRQMNARVPVFTIYLPKYTVCYNK